MTLSPGTKLGPYDITAPLGAGGMGEVYRARDTRLDRDVAIKVLPDAVAHDKERVLRFEREAKLLATLSHPNIAAIYGFEEENGQRFLALEYVEGETLASRLNQGPLPVDEALETCKSIAQALEAAHEKGVVHRDLKPGNVMLKPDGTVKVLDFGLARAMQDGTGSTSVRVDSPTITADYTKPGVVLGTAPYMSPEQARGRQVDKRSDIWSFGVILYECLTGEVLFRGETATDSLGAIMHREPQWAMLPPGTPPTVQLLLRRCLTKDRNKRLHDIADARIELETAITDPSASSLGLAQSALQSEPKKPRRLIRTGIGTVALLLAVGIGAGLTWYFQPPAPVRKFEFAVNNFLPESGVAISPDGRKIAYISQDQIWIRELDRLESQPLPDSADARNPFWSPDSAYVGFMRRGQLWKSALRGGVSVICKMAQQETPVGGAVWGQDDRIIFTTGNAGLYDVPAQGGDAKTLLEPDKDAGERDFHQPALLPRGRGIIFVVHGRRGPDTIALYSGGSRKDLLHQAGERFGSPVYSPTGHLLYQRAKTTRGTWAQPFSLSKLELSGEAFLAAPGSFVATLSADGTMVFVPGDPGIELRLAWADRQGKVLGMIGQPQADMFGPAMSPDGTRVAVSAQEGEGRDIWIHDVARGTKTRFTFNPEDEFQPRWSPDGRDIAYTVVNTNWMLKAADGVGQPRDMGEGGSPSFTPDGKAVVLVRFGKESKTQSDLWYLPLDGKGDPKPFLKTPAHERSPVVSPDGHYLAYISNESGRDEIYLTRFPSAEGKWQVTVEGGRNVAWNPKGKELFYVNANSLYCVDVQADAGLVLGTPKKMFDGDKIGIPLWRGYDVAPDGQRVLVIASENQKQTTPSIIVVENWFEEFRKR